MKDIEKVGKLPFTRKTMHEMLGEKPEEKEAAPKTTQPIKEDKAKEQKQTAKPIIANKNHKIINQIDLLFLTKIIYKNSDSDKIFPKTIFLATSKLVFISMKLEIDLVNIVHKLTDTVLSSLDRKSNKALEFRKS